VNKPTVQDRIQSFPKTVASVILAGGLSARMGAFKPLLPWGRTSIVGHLLNVLGHAGDIDPIVIVTGHNAGDVATAVGTRDDVVLAHNPDYARAGMLSSIQTGLRAVPANSAAVLLTLVDQPAVQVNTLRTLLESRRATGASILIPRHGRQRGHPVILSTEHVPEILALGPNESLKTFMDRHRAEAREIGVDDPAVLDDLDTPEDYRRALERYRPE
jgi:molybdenum cofactor cytidylyltransferase